MKQFASESGLHWPKTREEYNGLTKRAWDYGKHYSRNMTELFFPTDQAWKHFNEFADLLQLAEPYNSRSTADELKQNLKGAMFTFLKGGELPDTVSELLHAMNNGYLKELENYCARSFCRLEGIELEFEHFVRVGNCWIGKYGLISLARTLEQDVEWTKAVPGMLERVFDEDTPVIVGDIVTGSHDLTAEISSNQCDLALALIQVLINLSFDAAFRKLSNIIRFDSGASGSSHHLQFRLYGDNYLLDKISIESNSGGIPYILNSQVIADWYEYFQLQLINSVISKGKYSNNNLLIRLENSVLFFRQATMQKSPDMQLATLWISIESFFTANNGAIGEANISGLVTITQKTLRKEFWPATAKNVEELESLLKKHYGKRSRTFHHGKRDNVSLAEVQEFSILVSNLIICVAIAVGRGLSSIEELLQQAKHFRSVQE